MSKSHKTVIEIRPPFSSFGRYGWMTENHEPLPIGNAKPGVGRSMWRLYEDGKPLGPPHAQAFHIETEGRGRYLHWDHRIWLSTVDNSDPNTNGRRYTAVLSKDAVKEELDLFCRENFELLKGIVIGIFSHLPRPLDITKCSAVEIGPGPHLGPSLAMAGMGADMLVIDRVMTDWDPLYHGALAETIIARRSELPASVDAGRLRQCIETNSFAPLIQQYDRGLENASAAIERRFDLTISSSVLEHLADSRKAMESLYTLTKSGGMGVHHYGFLDHRDMSRPFEFLLMSDEKFEAAHGEQYWRYEFGNRIMPAEMMCLLEAAGFEDVEFHPTTPTPASYLKDFIPRLRASPSRFADLSIDEVKYTDGYLTFVTP